MITIKKGTLERIANWEDDSIYVLTDFDRTITVGKSDSSWGILSKSNLVPKEYKEERQKLYAHYRPIEIDETIDYDTKCQLMTEWWNAHIGLLVKYQLSEEIVYMAAQNPEVMAFRPGAKEFLASMHKRHIPVIIMSAGIGNFIEQLLINNDCYYDNIFIVSNFLAFENGYAIGISDNLIHSLNKNEISLPLEISSLIKERKHTILLGDIIADIRMAREEAREDALKIGFLDENIAENETLYKEHFDIVCTDEATYEELFEYLNILNK